MSSTPNAETLLGQRYAYLSMLDEMIGSFERCGHGADAAEWRERRAEAATLTRTLRARMGLEPDPLLEPPADPVCPVDGADCDGCCGVREPCPDCTDRTATAPETKDSAV